MNALATSAVIARKVKTVLPPEELALFRGATGSPLLLEYSQSTSFLLLKKFEKLIQNYVLDEDQNLWRREFRKYAQEFIRYHYLLDKLSVVDSQSLLAEELRSRQSSVRNRYALAQIVFFDFVDGRIIRLAGQEPINDWFREGKEYFNRLEIAVLGHEA